MSNQKNTIKTKSFLIAILIIAVTHILCNADENPPAIVNVESRPPVLTKAVLCEGIKGSKTPINESVVFSAELGELYCFTNFGPVYEETVIIHRYYFKDKLTWRKRLKLYPPGWAASSSIQPRETDKGPWRVDITDAEGKILHSIRFSITD
jgi:hypothetical protein